MAYAKKMNRTVKLLGTSKKVGDKVSAMVAPFLVDAASPLYAVNDVFNAVLVKGNMLGDTMFYGAGAGKLPTASAVVADVIDIACNLDRNIPIIWDKDKLGLTEYENIVNDYFVRVSDEDGKAADKVYGAFDEVEVVDEPLDKEYAFIVRQMSEGDFNKLLAKIDNVLNVIRIK